MKKIGLFFGGKVSRHLRLIRKAGRKIGMDLNLVSYNKVFFDTEKREIKLRKGKSMEEGFEKVSDFDVCFFRTTGKHWEEVGLITDGIDKKRTVVVDPMVWRGKPSVALKAWQMIKLKQNGIDVPRSIYGSLQFLRDNGSKYFDFPLIVKGSGGDRGTRVYIVYSQNELDKLTRELRRSEIEEGKRYMAQEFIDNDGDYRVLVMGDKVLGAMKRSRQKKGEFRNNYSAGGKVEIAKVSDEIKKIAIEATRKCGLMIAGVDVAYRDFDKNKPVIWEVNKGPQFTGFMKATGIDVPREIVKFLSKINLKNYQKRYKEWL